MNKQELVELISEETETPRAAVEEVLDATLRTIKGTVVEGDSVQLIGFGSFAPGERAARTGKHPQTGEPVEIAATRTVNFVADNSFKDALNAR